MFSSLNKEMMGVGLVRCGMRRFRTSGRQNTPFFGFAAPTCNTIS